MGKNLNRQNRGKKTYHHIKTFWLTIIIQVTEMVWKQLYSLIDNFSSPDITLCHAMKLYNADTVPVGLLNGKHAKITQQQLRKISKGLCLVAELSFSSDNFKQRECRKRTLSVKTLNKV